MKARPRRKSQIVAKKDCTCVYTINRKKICPLHSIDSLNSEDLLFFNTPPYQHNTILPTPAWRILYPINLRSFDTVETINFRKCQIKLKQKINNKNYFCDLCLLNFEKCAFQRHIIKCKTILGTLIYKEKTLKIYMFDGEKHINYCRRLCTIGKMFIDHKTLLYDVEPFEFYVLYQNDLLVGFFSKEKISIHNLSCIVVLPSYQGKGFGYFLVDISYTLRKGTPEKPLSEQGLVLYKRYWCKKVYKVISSMDSVVLDEIADRCNMTVNDVVYALEMLDFIRCKNGVYYFEFSKKDLKDMRGCKIQYFIK